MSLPAFTTSFTGLRLRAPSSNRSSSPRCAMASDSVAPKITIPAGRTDKTAYVDWVPVAPKNAEAYLVLSNVALNLSLRSYPRSPPAPPATPLPVPPSTSPKDFYFPPETRNLAPVISFTESEGVSVSYDKINPTVAGVSANSQDSIAFWKAPVYKYTAPDAPAVQPQETLSSALYERYFPSSVRNNAPFIRMKKPAGDWDNSAFLEVGSEFVQLNPDLASRLTVSTGLDTPAISAAATIAKYYGDDFAFKAPHFTIDRRVPIVEFYLAEVELPLEEAKAILEAQRAA